MRSKLIKSVKKDPEEKLDNIIKLEKMLNNPDLMFFLEYSAHMDLKSYFWSEKRALPTGYDVKNQ